MDINQNSEVGDFLLKEIVKCRACRFCVDVCPTYQVTEWSESMSPYGRLQIIKYMLNGILDEDDPLIYSLYSCLQCGRCDRVCKAKGQDLNISDLIRQGKNYLSHGLLKGRRNEKV